MTVPVRVAQAQAKINLGLHVLRKREDGFHDLETVFVRIPWADQVLVRPAASLSMTCSDPALPTDERNLCMKAARALAQAYGVTTGAQIHLEKKVPYGAGLGGGSSDAATTLRLLASLWRLDVSMQDLMPLAATLGSDIPFFLGDGAAYGTGRGEILEPFIDPQSGTPFQVTHPLVVAVPPIHVGTAEAYQRIRPNDQHRPDLRILVGSNDVDRWQEALVNDFEEPVIKHYPRIGAVKEQLLGKGAVYASMSGSGSAVFGLFTTPMQAEDAASSLRQQGCQVFVG